ncbi:hypothetical protein [Fibrella forsythiae]|uniref:Uncharacterized protein n=1 Tax=Fibrella forsythiae TaxID=2817061 RepID=A0ABS3JER4_9BACT|nr:hypothetical protein [Fibrella forsythiae]MBO0948488.1 hypothetical protein [Fibrella forsythiae]
MRLLFNTSSARGQSVAGLLIALPIAIWLWALLRYAVDVVYNDDYALLTFIARWHNPAVSWSDRFADLVALHNTHRIIYDRLVSLASYYLTGQINFVLMIWLGNLALGGICWQLWRGFRQLGLPAWYFLPIPCWLFSMQSHENMFWSMAALQNFTVIWFVQEALHQVHKRAPLGWPLLLSIGAALTSGNGVLAFLIGAILLVSQQRRDRTLWVWLSYTVVALILLLVIFPAAHERTPLLGWVPNLFVVLGSAFTNETTTTIPLAGGALLTTAIGITALFRVTRFGAVGRRLRQLPGLPEWLAFGLFVIATALLLAMHRLPDELLRDRYKLYAHLMLSLVYLVGLAVAGPRLKVGWALTGTLLAVVMNAIAFHACLPKIIGGFQQRQADAFNFRTNATTLAIPYLRSYTDSLLTSTQQQHIYTLPNPIKPPAAWSVTPSTDSLLISSFQDDFIHNSFLGEHPCYIEIDNQTVAHTLATGTDKGMYITISDKQQHTYLFPASPGKGSIRDFVTGQGLFKPGFAVSFLSSRLKPGLYQVKLLRITPNGYQQLGAGQPLDIQSVY